MAIWLTFIGQIGSSALWMVQGLQGAPRRFAILPDHYLTLSQAALPFVWVMGAAQLLFLFNIVQTIRGKQPKRRFAAATIEAMVMTGAVVVLTAAAAGGLWAGIGFGGKSGGSAAAPATPAQLVARGKAVFASAGCGACHTLAAAGAAASVGPNLDQRQPAATLRLSRSSWNFATAVPV